MWNAADAAQSPSADSPASSDVRRGMTVEDSEHKDCSADSLHETLRGPRGVYPATRVPENGFRTVWDQAGAEPSLNVMQSLPVRRGLFVFVL